MVDKWQEFYTPVGLVRYAALFTPQAGKPFRPGDAPPPPRYSVEIILDPKLVEANAGEKRRYEELRAYCQELGMEAFPVLKNPDGKPIPGTGFLEYVKMKTAKWPFRDSLERAGKTGYEPGTIFFRATLNAVKPSKSSVVQAEACAPPTVVGPDARTILEERDVYPGCYGRAKVTACSYDLGGGRGVKLILRGFQKAREGAPIMGMAAPATFESLEEESDFMQDQTAGTETAFGGLV